MSIPLVITDNVDCGVIVGWTVKVTFSFAVRESECVDVNYFHIHGVAFSHKKEITERREVAPC